MEHQHAAAESERSSRSRVIAGGTRTTIGQGAHGFQRMIGNQWTGMQSRRGAILQAKLSIGAPIDHYEQEADRVADQVVNGYGASSVLSDAGGPVRRACAACAAGGAPCPKCDEEQVQRMPIAGSITPLVQRESDEEMPEEEEEMVQGKHAPPSAQSAGTPATSRQEGMINALRGGGAPLAPSVREYMEPRFGRDFGDVRIHTDDRAAESARSIGALAYTIGRDVVFGGGQYNPETREGARLLAHELTHVVQQRGSAGGSIGRVQRANPDYAIRGVYPGAASIPNIIFFDRGSFNIPSTEQSKIAGLATPANRRLTLIGYTSEEGGAAGNTAIINARINRVSSELASAGHTALRTPDPQITAGEGQIDYRRMRAVEVVPTPAAGPPPSSQPRCAVTVANPTPQVEPCGSSFTTAHPLATTMLTKAIEAVNGTSSNAALNAAAPGHIATLFPGVATATIQAGLSSLQTQLGVMNVRHQCHNSCDAGCNRPGYNSGSGPTAMMTLCPGFIYGGSANENALLLLHEGLHATVGVTAIDIAYRSSRMITNISGAQATQNTDSWVLLILRLNPAVSASGPPTDTLTGMTGTEERQAREALAFLESWLLTAEFDVSILYDAIKRNVGRAGGWAAADNYHAGTQHVIGWLFGLTDPGASAPYTTAPTRDDQINVAGIYDRYTRMRQALWVRSITINKITSGTESWAPNLGTSVNIDASFFGLSQLDRVRRLFRLMIQSMPDIPSTRETAYTEGANQIRWHRGGVGPP